MKHLSPNRLQTAAEGGALRPAEREHLQSCAECRAELAAFRELLAQFQTMPEPPKHLDQAVMQRLGLAPQRNPWRWSWGLGGALAGALSLLLFLGHRPVPGPRACPSASATPSQRRACAPKHAVAKAGVQPAPAASELPPVAPSPGPDQSLGLSAHAAEPAQGQAPAPATVNSRSVRSEDLKSPTPGPAKALVQSVQNNLMKPGSGALTVRLDLPASGLLNAIIFDQRGRAVAELYNGPAAAGPETLRWDAAGAASGPYTLLIRSQGQAQTVKLLVVR